MRFNEFKLVEAVTNDFYTVGDSHARGVGTMAGLADTHNLAVNGAAAHGRGKGKEMLANISKIPKGANVLISVGANDTADVVKQNKDSKGKTPLPPTSKIVGDVMKVVNAVRAQGPKTIIFMLFPSGDNKKTEFYAGDYQKEVRNALSSAVGVKVIDYDGSPLQNDGIHYQFTVYKKAATDARKDFGVPSPVGNQNARPENRPTKDTDAQQSSNSSTAQQSSNSSTAQQSSNSSTAQQSSNSSTAQQSSNNSNKVNLDDPRVAPWFKGNSPKNSDKDEVDLSVDPGVEYLTKLNKPNSNRPSTNTTTSNPPAVVPAPAPPSNANKNDKKDNRQDNKQNAEVKPAGLPIVPIKSVSSGKIGNILDLIASVEAIGGNYNSVARRSAGKRIIDNPPLTNATIATIFKFQEKLKIKNDGWSDAVGRYQYIGSTLREKVGQMGLASNTTRFSPETQDSIATYHMRRQCDLDGWLNNRVSDVDFLENLSRVWAGLPCPSKGGNSYFKYDRAGIPMDKALGILKTIRERR
jgi:hypothetical protein